MYHNMRMYLIIEDFYKLDTGNNFVTTSQLPYLKLEKGNA